MHVKLYSEYDLQDLTLVGLRHKGIPEKVWGWSVIIRVQDKDKRSNG